MKTKKIVIAFLTVCFALTLLSSCHRSTCPTFNKGEVEEPTELRV
ncbi:hypothetical protein N9G63_01635 [Chitinophagales bacterium]|nr:hypothetical protein [Chitinophagales bacterium]